MDDWHFQGGARGKKKSQRKKSRFAEQAMGFFPFPFENALTKVVCGPCFPHFSSDAIPPNPKEPEAKRAPGFVKNCNV